MLVETRSVESPELWNAEPLLGASEQPVAALASRRQALAELASQPVSSVCVISTATGAYSTATKAGAALLENKRDFCRVCGYRCLLHTDGKHSTSRPAKWDKLLVIHDALRTCDITLYVDADVVFRHAFQLRPLTQTWLAGTKDFVGLNSGVLLAVRSKEAREFLPAAWNYSFFNRSFNAEQNAIRLALRRPFVEKRGYMDGVTIFENMCSYMFFHSPYGKRVLKYANFTAPLHHAAGCTVSSSAWRCQEKLLRELPAGRFRTCPSIEQHFDARSPIFRRNTQRVGNTNLGRRWLIGRDVQIKYTDQKGTDKSQHWWQQHPGCYEHGCIDASKIDAKKKGLAKSKKKKSSGDASKIIN
jgi:hypothetical protein